jgi:hypothetical protein
LKLKQSKAKGTTHVMSVDMQPLTSYTLLCCLLGLVYLGLLANGFNQVLLACHLTPVTHLPWKIL